MEKNAKTVKSLELVFPYGESEIICDRIAQYANEIAASKVSEGGMKPLTNPYYDEHMKFSDSEMVYVFGHTQPTDPKDE
jgi:hypothetical protein